MGSPYTIGRKATSDPRTLTGHYLINLNGYQVAGHPSKALKQVKVAGVFDPSFY